MEVFQTRLDSFLKGKRVKSTAGTTRSASVKWPHPNHFLATPNSLAEAGFYFCPTWADRDAVKCYMCGKELSDWLEDDDPFIIHWNRCHTSCLWAVLRCGIHRDLDQDGNFIFSDPMRVPSSEHMRNARLKTFTNWPHDTDKPHGATSERMALAGFVYTPQSRGDDTATCLYCNVALSGWEIDDDPLQEHRKRDKKSKSRCPLFVDEKLDILRRSTRTASSSHATNPIRDEVQEEKPTVRKKPLKSKRKTKETSPSPERDRKAERLRPILEEHHDDTANSPLSAMPVNKTVSVNEKEMDMTVEEWIRHEMNLQYGLFKADGERMINSFKERTVEVRQTIQAL